MWKRILQSASIWPLKRFSKIFCGPVPQRSHPATYLIPASISFGLVFAAAEPSCQICFKCETRVPSPNSNCPECNPDTNPKCTPRVPAKTNEPEELTHNFLIKQASGLVVDSVTRLLTEAVSALDDYHSEYREMIKFLSNLLEESRCTSEVNMELINCKMIVLRSQMADVRRNLDEIEMFLRSVDALANQTAQTAYLARAEYPSVALSERLQSALFTANRIRSETKDLENDLVQLQAVVIVESGKSLK